MVGYDEQTFEKTLRKITNKMQKDAYELYRYLHTHGIERPDIQVMPGYWEGIIQLNMARLAKEKQR